MNRTELKQRAMTGRALLTGWTTKKRDAVFKLNLTPRQEQILRMRLDEGKTLKEVGERYAVGPERIRYIELKSYARLVD